MVGGIDMKYYKIDMQYYKVGDKVRIKSLDWYNENKDKTNEIAIETIIRG